MRRRALCWNALWNGGGNCGILRRDRVCGHVFVKRVVHHQNSNPRSWQCNKYMYYLLENVCIQQSASTHHLALGNRLPPRLSRRRRLLWRLHSCPILFLHHQWQSGDGPMDPSLFQLASRHKRNPCVVGLGFRRERRCHWPRDGRLSSLPISLFAFWLVPVKRMIDPLGQLFNDLDRQELVTIRSNQNDIKNRTAFASLISAGICRYP